MRRWCLGRVPRFNLFLLQTPDLILFHFFRYFSRLFRFFAVFDFVFPLCLDDESEHLALRRPHHFSCSSVIVHDGALYVITGVRIDLNSRSFRRSTQDFDVSYCRCLAKDDLAQRSRFLTSRVSCCMNDISWSKYFTFPSDVALWTLISSISTSLCLFHLWLERIFVLSGWISTRFLSVALLRSVIIFLSCLSKFVMRSTEIHRQCPKAQLKSSGLGHGTSQPRKPHEEAVGTGLRICTWRSLENYFRGCCLNRKSWVSIHQLTLRLWQPHAVSPETYSVHAWHDLASLTRTRPFAVFPMFCHGNVFRVLRWLCGTQVFGVQVTQMRCACSSIQKNRKLFWSNACRQHIWVRAKGTRMQHDTTGNVRVKHCSCWESINTPLHVTNCLGVTWPSTLPTWLAHTEIWVPASEIRSDPVTSTSPRKLAFQSLGCLSTLHDWEWWKSFKNSQKTVDNRAKTWICSSIFRRQQFRASFRNDTVLIKFCSVFSLHTKVFLAMDWYARQFKNATRMSWSIVFVRGSAICRWVGNHVSKMFSTDRNPFLSTDTTNSEPLIVPLPNVLLDCARQAAAVSEHVRWPLQALLRNVRSRAACQKHLCQEMSRPLSRLEPFIHNTPSAASVDLTTLLIVVPTGDRAQVKSSSFHKVRRMSETDHFSICRSSVCVTDHGTCFEVHDTTRNDNAHFCCAWRWIDQFVQRFDMGQRRFAQSPSSQRHTNAHIRSRLLSRPQLPVISALVSALSSVLPARSALRYSNPSVDFPQFEWVQDDSMTAPVSENTIDSRPVRSRCACTEVRL